jgi:Na+/melibiose symporter-like transporter
MRYGKEFYRKYKNYILFDKNIIIAGIAALIVGTFFTQFYSQQNKNNFLNSIVTLSVEYAVYIPLFALFFYFDNKRRYIDPTSGKKNYKNIKSDIIKLFAIFSLSEIIFAVSKVSIHFQLMQISYEPYQATTTGSLTSWIIFLVIINFGANVVKLFKNSNN